MSIGFSIFVVIIASLNLVLDFDFIEEGAEQGAGPQVRGGAGADGLAVPDQLLTVARRSPHSTHTLSTGIMAAPQFSQVKGSGLSLAVASADCSMSCGTALANGSSKSDTAATLVSVMSEARPWLPMAGAAGAAEVEVLGRVAVAPDC